MWLSPVEVGFKLSINPINFPYLMFVSKEKLKYENKNTEFMERSAFKATIFITWSV